MNYTKSDIPSQFLIVIRVWPPNVYLLYSFGRTFCQPGGGVLHLVISRGVAMAVVNP